LLGLSLEFNFLYKNITIKQSIMQHNTRKPTYEALKFPDCYPSQGEMDTAIHGILTAIYDLRHKGWTRLEIIQKLSKDYPQVQQSVIDTRCKTIQKPFEKSNFNFNGVPAVNGGVMAHKHIHNITDAEAILFRPFHVTRSDAKIGLEDRKKIIVLRLNGASVKQTHYITSIPESAINNCMYLVYESFLEEVDWDLYEDLVEAGYKDKPLLYSQLLMLYASGKLNFGSSCEMANFSNKIERAYGRKIYTADEVMNLISF
jgi:hypothetical protein